MLSSQVKFSEDRQMDTGKTICPHLSMRGHKNQVTLVTWYGYWVKKDRLRLTFGFSLDFYSTVRLNFHFHLMLQHNFS